MQWWYHQIILEGFYCNRLHTYNFLLVHWKKLPSFSYNNSLQLLYILYDCLHLDSFNTSYFIFNSYDYHISEGSKEDMPGLVCYMYIETFADVHFERNILADFALTILQCYRDNPYHNAEHAFCFTHTMYLILINNSGYFDFVEVRNRRNKQNSFDFEIIGILKR